MRYGEQKALIGIQSLTLLRGRLSPRVFGLVMEWASEHQAELMINWDRTRRQAELARIKPLESSYVDRVIDVCVIDDYQLDLRFEDGVQGVVDVADLVPFTGVFAPLCSHDYFRRVRVDAELGTVTWPNGADLDPDVLYSLVTGEPILLAEPEALLVA